MAFNWNFRTILSLHPELESFTCVSVSSDNKTRCHNRRPLLSDIDLAKAGGILDAMDRCESLKASYKFLNELVRLTLCIIHSEEDDQVEPISAMWQTMIEKHMKMEVGTVIRPKSRRSLGRRRTSSITVMTVLKEERAEQSPTSATKGPASRIPVRSPARPSPSPTTAARPTRSLSRRISTLITEVGFQDAANEKFSPSIETPPNSNKAPPMPTRAPPTPVARKMPSRSKTQYPPARAESDEWSSYPLLSLLSRDSNVMKSDQQLGDQMAKAIEAGARASRKRRDTASSVGSSTTGSKTSSGDSDSGSSAPTSRSSSVRNSPELKATGEGGMETFPVFPLPPSMITSTPLSTSPKQAALPTFDFGIFQSLPLPPGHKQSISNHKELTPVSDKKMWTEEAHAVNVPPRSFEFDSSRPSFALKGLEKPRSRKNSQRCHPPAAELMKASATKEVRDETEDAHEIDVADLVHERLETPTKESITLPDCDRVSMISTSWLNAPSISRSSSVRSFSGLSRKSSTSRSPPVSRSASTSGKLSRTNSFSLSRSLSRTLSRRGSTKASPKIDGEPSGTSTPPKRASSFSFRKTKEETVSLPRLIQMSHELARRLDGYESHGHVEVLPVTRYTYQLPSTSVARSSSPATELRFSRLFMNDVSLNFPFSIPVQQGNGNLAKDEYEWLATGRSKSVGNGSAPPSEMPKFVRPGMNLNTKLGPIPKTAPRETKVELPMLEIPRKPLTEVEVCAMCGNTQTIWGRCDCESPVAAKGKIRGKSRAKTTTRTPEFGERPTIIGKMERRPTKRGPRRTSTMRRLRRRVVRAFSI